MTKMHLRSLVFASLLVAAACGKKAPETMPDPTPTDRGNTGTVTPPPPPPPPPPPAADPNAAARERENLLRVLQQPIHFEYDMDQVRPDDAAILDQKAAILLANPSLRIRISGHADERGSDEYNLVLGTRRATAAKRYLEAKGIDGSRIEVISFGEEQPADPGSSEAAWAKNRRDDFQIVSGGDRLVSPR
jgi:peptidoglycan-associated lipoprotein